MDKILPVIADDKGVSNTFGDSKGCASNEILLYSDAISSAFGRS